MAPGDDRRDARREPVGPGRFGQHAAGVGVAALGNRATAGRRAAGVFTRYQSEVGHELARIIESVDPANLCGERGGDHQLDPAQGLQSLYQRLEPPLGHRIAQVAFDAFKAIARRSHRFHVFLKDDLLHRLIQLDTRNPAHVRRCPSGLACIAYPRAKQEGFELVTCARLRLLGVLTCACRWRIRRS